MTFKEQVENHFRNNYLAMFKQAKGMLKDHHYAEDAVQDAMYQALKYGHEGVENFDGWIGMLLYNACRKMAKDIKAKGVTMEVDPHLFPVEVFDVSPESLINLSEVIEKLFPDSVERKALILWIIKGYEVKDLSRDFNIPKSRFYYMWRMVKEEASGVSL